VSTIKQLLTIEESEAANDISFIMIYFAFYRENHFKQFGSFKSDDIRTLLKNRLVNGSGTFRANVADHFKILLYRNEIEFAILVPYLQAIVSCQSGNVTNHHLYEIMAKEAAGHPQIVGRLIEEMVSHELKSLDLGGRDIWHPKEFSEALRALEQAGPEHKERVDKIRGSIEPHRNERRIFDVDDF
jgi:hypothetical protein